MRTAIFFLGGAVALVLGCVPAQAQETDERMARILKPDINSTSNLQNKGFYGGKSFTSQTAYTKSFYLSQSFSAKKYDTRDYNAGKYWAGDYYQGQKNATTAGKYSIPNSGKAADVKTQEVKTAREAGKANPVQDYAGNRPYLVQGKSQKALDQDNGPTKKAMSVDELRELLNKTR